MGRPMGARPAGPARALLMALALGGCGTEVTDPYELCLQGAKDEVMVGCLESSDGRPVADIRVIASAGSGPVAKPASGAAGLPGARDTVRTDKHGRYAFKRDRLPGSGKVQLWAIDAEDRLYYIGAEDKVLEVTLPRSERAEILAVKLIYPTGRLRGLVLDGQSGEPVASAVCGVLARAHTALLDEGRFLLDLPPGTHRIGCQARGYLDSEPMEVEVREGDDAEVTLRLKRSYELEVAPPAPMNAAARYDSITGIVHLTWDRVEWTEAVEYQWMRFEPGNTPAAEVDYAKVNSAYDVLFDPWVDRARLPQEPKILIYNIWTRKVGGANTQSLSKATVELKPVRPWSPPGPEVQVSPLDSLGACTVGDTARIAGTFSNPLRRNATLFWTQNDLALDKAGMPMDLRHRDLADSAGTDTLSFHCATQGTYRLRLVVKDEDGAFSSAAVPLQVKPRP